MLAMLGGLLAIASSANAVDGVAEINHVCAAQTGCFNGDTAGYPVTIDGSAGRSYRLTGDLIVPDENTHGIELQASDVSVDLNGFSIIRAACVDVTTSCMTILGTGSGIYASSLRRGVSVRNGSIIGMGRSGVTLGVHAEVKSLRVRWNRSHGVFVSLGSSVSDNIVYENGWSGISSSSQSMTSNNIVYQNGNDGIQAGSYSTVSGNTIHGNGGDGIDTNSGCLVQGNTVSENQGIGLHLEVTDAYRDNNLTSLGATVDGGVDAGGNVCNGSTTCP